ncbi:MAG: hypothetical protein Kow0031_09020 [Anaerolineae bacterium]
MPHIRQLDPRDVIFIQSRTEINHDIVAEYQTLMEDGVQFDPASGLEDDSGQLFIWDGSHRGEAARRANLPLTVRLEPGSREQAEWLALSANQKHGLRRSRADKRLAIQQALRHPNGVSLSDREIARHCGVDHKTVGQIRSELETAGEIPRITERVVTREGTTYWQDTGKLNNFVPVEQLVEALQTALTRETGNLLTSIHWLTAIKRGDPQGEIWLAALSGQLPTPHRPRDLQTACRTLLNHLRQKIHTDYENLCPHCRGAVYYSRDLGHLFCDSCEQTWGYTNAFNTAVQAVSIDSILKKTLLGGPDRARWAAAQQQGVTDKQLSQMIAERWKRGIGAENELGMGYWVTGRRLWVGRNVLDPAARPTTPTLAGTELLVAVRDALGLPFPEEPAETLPLPASIATTPEPPANGHHYVLEEKAQPHPCPQCGEQRVRGVNGSQRWCIGCGANWPTAGTFLAAVAAAEQNGSTAVRRERLAARFNDLLPQLTPVQIERLEAALETLQTQPEIG